MSQQKRILALGDSYTIGTGILPFESWPHQLTRQLAASGMTAAHLRVLAQNGWTSANLLAALRGAAPTPGFDLVILLIGVNDQYNSIPPKQYHQRLSDLLSESIGRAGENSQRVLLLSIPDWSVTPFGKMLAGEHIASETRRLNAINLERSQAFNTHYLDITTVSHRATDDATLLAADGLHFSAKMYAQWVTRMLPVVRKILTT